MTNWRKDASNKLTGIRYTLFVMDKCRPASENYVSCIGIAPPEG